MKETDLYLPVKAYLEHLGCTVKSEIKGCDIVAVSNNSDSRTYPIIVELKLSFTLELIHQGINRQKLSDEVYVAVPEPDTAIKRRNWRSKLKSNLTLCRLLGLGLMTVNMDTQSYEGVKVLIDPAPYAPRKNKKRQQSLQKEFNQRVGDPNSAGMSKQTIMTAYRQRVLLCASYLSKEQGMSIKALKLACEIKDCAQILQKNYYKWFERVKRGEYCLTGAGQIAVNEHKELITTIKLAALDRETKEVSGK